MGGAVGQCTLLPNFISAAEADAARSNASALILFLALGTIATTEASPFRASKAVLAVLVFVIL